MLFGAEPDVQIQLAWIGVATVIITGIFGVIVAIVSRSTKSETSETKTSIVSVDEKMILIENSWKDMRTERNQARRAEQQQRERADQQTARADRALHLVDQQAMKIERLEKALADCRAGAD